MKIERNISLSRLLLRLSRIKQVRELNISTSEKKSIGFIDLLLQKLGVSYEIGAEDLNRIPKSDSFIIVANHPFGELEDLLLLRIFAGERKDFKIFSNSILRKSGVSEDFFLSESPFSGNGKAVEKRRRILSLARHIEEGAAIGIFPSARVSGYDLNSNNITDRQWSDKAVKFIKNAEVPVLPVYFKGSNSLFFHMLGLIHPSLQAFKLTSELFNKKNSCIELRIGNPISVKDQAEFTDIPKFGRYLRAKTYALGTSLEVKSFYSPGSKPLSQTEEIIKPIPAKVIDSELKSLHPESVLFEIKPYRIYFVPSSEIPNTIKEIGRLREETFRLVGEGTNKQIDLDEYDIYYHHLFIWDEDARKIAGAYRLGMGAEILKKYGKSGFYLDSLYRISEGFLPVMNLAIELGRSFIAAEYQKKPLPLFALWKGILYCLLKHPEYRYLIGPVSISNKFSHFSRNLMIEYLHRYYYRSDYARFVKPRNKFAAYTGEVDTQILLEVSKNIAMLDKHIKDVDLDEVGVPVLLKKYLSLNGKIIAFNVDADFNDCIDGFLIIDKLEIPQQVITSLSKELAEPALLKCFTVKGKVE